MSFFFWLRRETRVGSLCFFLQGSDRNLLIIRGGCFGGGEVFFSLGPKPYSERRRKKTILFVCLLVSLIYSPFFLHRMKDGESVRTNGFKSSSRGMVNLVISMNRRW